MKKVVLISMSVSLLFLYGCGVSSKYVGQWYSYNINGKAVDSFQIKKNHQNFIIESKSLFGGTVISIGHLKHGCVVLNDEKPEETETMCYLFDRRVLWYGNVGYMKKEKQ